MRAPSRLSSAVRCPGAFFARGADEESEHAALMFAAHAAVAYATAQRREAAARTVATRQLIGRAEGIAIERHRITAEQGFAMLVRVSQQRNAKLREVAERLVSTGDLDKSPARLSINGRVHDGFV